MTEHAMKRILLVGGTGQLGRELAVLLQKRGHFVRLLTRRKLTSELPTSEFWHGDLTVSESLQGCCDGIDAIISVAGGSLSLNPFKSRASFFTTDYDGHRNLLTEARRADVSKFVYVSVLPSSEVSNTFYVRAHEFFGQELLASAIPAVVIRPTGFFSTFQVILKLTRMRVFPLIGNGEGRTNPISEAALAGLCIDALEAEPGIIDAGGPDILSRKDIAEQAFRAQGLKPRFVYLPPGLVKLGLPLFRILGRRYFELMNFLVRVQLEDVVAPKQEGQRLSDFFSNCLNKT